MSIKGDYNSPRWTGEICDCSMPMTFDTYSGCMFNCLYCFAFFQKSHCVNGYKGKDSVRERDVRSVNVEQVKRLFVNCLNDEPETKKERQFYPYIKNRITMQWGGMADGFDTTEEVYGVSLELLRFFDEIDYPLSISTKGVFFTRDERYMSLIRKHKHNWHFKVSIITLDEERSRIMEQFCPSPLERVDAIKRLSDAGVHVTLRLRPYIIGLSDDYPLLIRKAYEAGADSVTTEFFCLEMRANDELKHKYDIMSKLLGYDIYAYYRKHSTGSGYLRLNYGLKRKVILDMRRLAHKYKMRFYVSDAHHKEKCDATCCCGTPPSFKIYRGQFNEALLLARSSPEHKVYWKDIKSYADNVLRHVRVYDANGYNIGGTRQRAKRYKQSMSEYLREVWNTPSSSKSPYKYFEGVLYPVGLDTDNNVIYKYNKDKAERGKKNG